jgi:tetratricopeptide (TPR) repeat protein
MKKTLILLAALLMLCACQKEEAPVAGSEVIRPATPTQVFPARQLLAEAITPVLVETAAEALPVWRHYAPGRPALLLLTSQPSMLLTPPPALAKPIRELVETADQPTLRRQTLPTLANPTLLPNMAITAALDAGFFSQVIWSIPLKPETTLTLEQFRARMVGDGVLTEKEAAAFRDEGGDFVGTLHNVPFTATVKAIPAQEGPLLLHLDLSYFRPGYHNEIRKPLNLHLREMLIRLRESHLSIIAATVSLSNLSGDLPLSTRFLGGNVRDLFIDPKQLDAAPASQEKLRADAMYLGNFFRKEEVLQKYQEMEKAAPQDPSVKYDLYQTLRQFNRSKEAQEKLSAAVALDQVYGLEFLSLAGLALEKERPDGALQMYEKAAAIFPDNPFILIYKARVYALLGHPEKVMEILTPLQDVAWSDIYFPQMKAEVEGMLAAAKNQGNGAGVTEHATRQRPGGAEEANASTQK